jgi:hypothetical protein
VGSLGSKINCTRENSRAAIIEEKVIEGKIPKEWEKFHFLA